MLTLNTYAFERMRLFFFETYAFGMRTIANRFINNNRKHSAGIYTHIVRVYKELPSAANDENT